MAEALAFEGGPGGDGVVAIADVNWRAARSHLNVLNSPSYRGLFSEQGGNEAPLHSAVDLRELSARLAPEEARRAVAQIVIEELARILRLPRADVSKSKPLSEIGLDSLMAVELTLALEARFGLEAPFAEAAGGFNVIELAGRILASQGGGDQNSIVAEGLAARHLEVAERAEVVEMIGTLQGHSVARGDGSS
jgi:acyl carrier protein